MSASRAQAVGGEGRALSGKSAKREKLSLSERERKLLRMMDVRRLVLLRQLADRGTVAAVAEAASMSPSAVSQQLAALQRELGVDLVERSGRYLHLTEAGKRLLAHADTILADVERAYADLAALTGTVTGVVRLGAFPTAARALVPSALARLGRVHPTVTIHLEELETHQALPALKQHTIDLALVYEYDLLPPFNEPTIELIPLTDDPLLLALPPNHPAIGDTVALAALRDERWITHHPDTLSHAATAQAWNLAGYNTPTLTYTTNDFAVILAFVEAGLGVSIVPRLALSGPLGSTTATLRTPAERPLSRRISLATRRGAIHHPVIAAIRNAFYTTPPPS